jgi:hypothetical protein
MILRMILSLSSSFSVVCEAGRPLDRDRTDAS